MKILYIQWRTKREGVSIIFFNKWGVISSAERTAGGSLIYGLNYECKPHNRICNQNAEYWFQRFGRSFKKQDMGHYYHSLINVRLHPPIYLQFFVIFSFDFESNSEINYSHNLFWLLSLLCNHGRDLSSKTHELSWSNFPLHTSAIALCHIVICFSAS